MGTYTGTWMQAAAGAASSALGIGFQRLGTNYDRRQQLKTQQGLTDLQMKAEKEMMDYQQEKELQMWNATNYGAQMKQLRSAGLNPGLLYGMGGSGGATIGHGGSPSITGGTAPLQNTTAMGIQAGMQMALLASQKRVLDTQADKNEAEAQKTAGVDTAKTKTEISSLTQGIENAKAQKELLEIQKNIAEIDEDIKLSTQNAAKAMVFQELRSSYERMEILRNEGIISKETYDEKIHIIEQELVGKYAQNALTRMQTAATKKGIDKTGYEMTNIKMNTNAISEHIALEFSKLQNEKDRTKIQQQIADFETSYGKQAADILRTVLGTSILKK